MRFLTSIAAGIRAEAPALGIGVRLSAFDMVPFSKGPDAVGEPEPVREPAMTRRSGTPRRARRGAVDDADAFLARLPALGIGWVCVSAGSPYYNPHIQRPALFPPSDGYLPPEDPLVGVARQIDATAAPEARGIPDLVLDRIGLQLPAGVAAERRRARDPPTASPTSSASGAWS